MAKFIEKSDLENLELKSLPIRRGCSGPCGCLGTCKNIEGYIDRKEYEDFMKTFITLNDFLNQKCKEEKKEEKLFPESVQHKMPEKSMNYKILEKPYQNWDDFFDEHAEGRRSEYKKGIDQRYLGYAGDVTLFWKSEEEYPFAYVFPKSIDLNFQSGYFFYLRDIK